MERQTLIQPVSDNKSKGNTYRALIGKYNEAMEKGYYGEAELIVYAFMEDRLRSFLYYCNAIDRKNSRGLNENMQAIFGECNNIDGINTKLDIIEKALKLVNKDAYTTAYAKELAKIFKIGFDVPEFRSQIKKIRKWCKYRNEIVHAMFNKDIDSLREGYREHVAQGFQFARYLDKQVYLLMRV